MIDPSTGLPELPEGYFFRIGKWSLRGSTYNVEVSIRRKTFWGRSVDTGCHHLATSTKEGIGGIQYAASVAREDLRRSNIVAAEPTKDILGDYPPKKYGVDK